MLAVGALVDKTEHHSLIAIGSFSYYYRANVATDDIGIPLRYYYTLVGYTNATASPKGAERKVFGWVFMSIGFNISRDGGPVLFGYLLEHGYPRDSSIRHQYWRLLTRSLR